MSFDNIFIDKSFARKVKLQRSFEFSAEPNEIAKVRKNLLVDREISKEKKTKEICWFSAYTILKNPINPGLSKALIFIISLRNWFKNTILLWRPMTIAIKKLLRKIKGRVMLNYEQYEIRKGRLNQVVKNWTVVR